VEATADPFVVIESRDGDAVTYRDLTDPTRRWVIRGECNRCGACEVGGVGWEDLPWTGEPGTPGALPYDPLHGEQLDNPITPDLPLDTPECSMTGEWL